MELNSINKIIQKRREIDEARIVGTSFMENLGFEIFSREGSIRSSGKKVGMSTECTEMCL